MEGFGLNYQASYSKQIDSTTNKYFSVAGKLRYGFSSERMYASMFTAIPLKNSRISFNMGSDVMDLNNLTPLSQLGNMINTLYYERNLLKVYENKFLGLTYSKSLGSVQTSISAGWSNRSALQNTTNYKIRDLERKEFTSNNPLMPDSDLPMFPQNQAFKIQFKASYAFSNDYATYPTGRYYRPSKYPQLNLNYSKGISGLLGSDVDYDLLTLDLSKNDIKSGLFGSSSFWIGAGKFLNSKSLYFVDYKHFMGNRLFSYSTATNNFLFLDYYKNSTPQRYFEAHVQHNFAGFLTNKLPYLRKLKLSEVIGFNYLSTPKMKNYSEGYVGLQYLNFRLVYGRSFQNAKVYDEGLRFGIVL